MFDRFTDRARKVMALANQEAHRLNHEAVGPEHLLLGLVKEGSGVGANVLKNLDADLRKVRIEVEKRVRAGAQPAAESRLPQHVSAKRVVASAIEEARNLNHNYVGTEHLLLGLLREHEGVIADVFAALGLEHETVRDEVEALLGAGVDPVEWSEPSGGPFELYEALLPLLQRAAEEAQKIGATTPTAELLLLAIARDPSSRAGAILHKAGLTPEHLEQLLRE